MGRQSRKAVEATPHLPDGIYSNQRWRLRGVCAVSFGSWLGFLFRHLTTIMRRSMPLQIQESSGLEDAECRLLRN